MTGPFFRRVLSFICTYEPVLASDWRLSYLGGLAVQDKSMGVNTCRLSAEALVIAKHWGKEFATYWRRCPPFAWTMNCCDGGNDYA